MSNGTVKKYQDLNSKAEYAYKFYLNKGYSPEQSSAIVGNIIRESNFDTSVVGKADDKGSRGIAQWHSDRLKKLQSMYGDRWTDLDNQLEFIDWELNNTHKSVGEKFKKTKGVWEAAKVFTDEFERPKVGWSGDEQRQAHVTDSYRRFGKKQLTEEDKKMFAVTWEKSVKPYMNVTSNVTNLQVPAQNTTFDSVPDVYKEESAQKQTEAEQAKQQIAQSQSEEDFIQAYKRKEQPQVQEEQQQPIDVLNTFAQVSAFVDNPVAQEGRRVLDPTAVKNFFNRLNKEEQDKKQAQELLSKSYRRNIPLDVKSEEYANAYKDNNAFRYDKNSDTYIGRELPELVIQGKSKEKGFWAQYTDNVVKEHRNDGVLGAIIGTPLDAVFGLPQKALMYGITGEVQKPSEAMGMKGAEAIMADVVADPLNLIGVGEVSGLNKLTKEELLTKLATSKESGLLSNTYKLNPWAFKTEANKFYRQVDNATFNEGLESGLIKGKQDVNTSAGEGVINLNKSFGEDAYYNKGSLYYKDNKNLPYLFEANLPEEAFIPKVNGRTKKFTRENTSVRVSVEPLSINNPNINTYKKDWLRGYKQVEVPAPQQQGGVVKDNDGYLNPKNWGKTIEISSPSITMEGVKEPLLGYSPETGETKLMQPGQNYFFTGAKKVIETPLTKAEKEFLKELQNAKNR